AFNSTMPTAIIKGSQRYGAGATSTAGNNIAAIRSDPDRDAGIGTGASSSSTSPAAVTMPHAHQFGPRKYPTPNIHEAASSAMPSQARLMIYLPPTVRPPAAKPRVGSQVA